MGNKVESGISVFINVSVTAIPTNCFGISIAIDFTWFSVPLTSSQVKCVVFLGWKVLQDRKEQGHSLALPQKTLSAWVQSLQSETFHLYQQP